MSGTQFRMALMPIRIPQPFPAGARQNFARVHTSCGIVALDMRMPVAFSALLLPYRSHSCCRIPREYLETA